MGDLMLTPRRQYLYSSYDLGIEKPKPLKCETCKESKEVLYCTSCEVLLCDDCWHLQIPHKPNKTLKHEKSSLDDAKIVYQTLKCPIPDILSDNSPRQRISQKDNAKHMWFGVTQDEENDYILGEGAAYYSLLLEDPIINPLNTNPCLVSFVGVTGAGKSALINLLIKFSQGEFPVLETPVVGDRGGFSSTSADVHLYSDPITIDTSCPMIYADCEGMQGNSDPSAAQHQRETESDQDQRALVPQQWLNEFKPIKVQLAGKNSAEGRENFTSNLYPRLLYIFSDVIIYVLQNTR
ncbi:hypothetical protein F5B19DRAFT_463449 [Rostrohypoxylon terebratum]|nr:hypothetical protein F5B19DRAFT_463449 [Rostrohypoxylon terebratum]